jgi:hypothetical protein
MDLIEPSDNPNAVAPEVPDGLVLELPPPTCSACRSWFPVGEGASVPKAVGQCRSGPPDVPTNEFRPDGRVFTYRLTLAALPACGSFAQGPLAV